jgi:hypothetical protein
LTRGCAVRLAGDDVTVNAVAPGLVDTEMGKPLIEAGVAARIPVGRVGTGDDIAQVVMLLVNDGYITGQTLAVNGGTPFSYATAVPLSPTRSRDARFRATLPRTNLTPRRPRASPRSIRT